MTNLLDKIIICLFTAGTCFGQTPKELTEKIIDKKISIISITSEQLNWLNVQLDTSAIKSGQNILIVSQSETTTIISLTVEGRETEEPPKPKQFDVYLFYVNSNGKWHLDDIKCSSVLFGLISMILPNLDNTESNKNKRDWINLNLGLASKTDAELKNYFIQNKQTFESLMMSAKKKSLTMTEEVIERSDSIMTKNLLGKLLLSYSFTKKPSSNWIAFSIADLGYSSIGFIYAPNINEVVKEFGDKRMIFTRDLKNGWYIFRYL